MGMPAPADTGPTTWTLDTGPLIGDEAVESPGASPPKPPSERAAPSIEEEAARPAADEAPAVKPPDEIVEEPPVLPHDEFIPEVKEPVPPKAPEPAPPAAKPEPTKREPELPPLVIDEPVMPEPAPPARPPVRVGATAPIGASGRSEIDELFEHNEYELRRRRPPDDGDSDPATAGRWLLAIAVTVVLAVLAGLLIFRGPDLFGGGGDAPSAAEVKSGIQQQFEDLDTMKTSFNIQRLGLYRIRNEDDSVQYTFSNGRYVGRFVYDRAEGYRQEFTLEAQVQDRNQQISQAEVLQKPDETRSVVGASESATVNVEKRPPLGPPDGQLRPQLGLLEDAVGSVVSLIAAADDLEVLGVEKLDDRDVYKVQFPVEATEQTRADRIEALLDTHFVPVSIKRSISREKAQVLGPETAVTDEVLDTAFADNERITTEVVELDNVIISDLVLPGDLVLDIPAGAKTQESDFAYARMSRTDAASKLDFKPLFPRELSSGMEEQQVAVYTGEPRAWGPNGAYPKPKTVLNATYFDGRTTIAVSERNVPSFNPTGSPLQGGGLPITVRAVNRAEKRFFYGTSPEVPPHVYGFLGGVFVVVSGYASEDALLDVIASLGEPAAEVPAQTATSPSPGASPTASPSL
jgi:hypothetical protein